MKVNSKWTKNLNVQLETLKLLEKNIGTSLENTGIDKAFLNRIPTA
jgi:hypothetical protein